MKIISEFVREQKRYSKIEIRQIFRLNDDKVNKFIHNLKSFGVLKSVKNSLEQKELSDLVDEDLELADLESDDDKVLYVFTYVGVITIGSRIIKCYPKYLLGKDNPVDEMKQILKVLEQYGTNQEMVYVYNGDGENRTFNLLAVILFLLNDYHNNGIYSNYDEVVEVNGDGNIIWDKTINESFALISNNKPYYMEMYTERTIVDDFDFFRRLHACILTECSNQLNNAGLIDLFDMVSVDLSEDTISDIGEIDYLLYRIQSELNVQYNTQKQILLKTIYAYLSHERAFEDDDRISMYGTNSFNLVWERVCSDVISNKLHTSLERLKLPVPLSDKYKGNKKLIDIIDKPVWSGKKTDGNIFQIEANDTLIPDLVTIIEQDHEYAFIIFDAKYYNLKLEEKLLRGHPGIGDVTKQYLYQLAYKDFLNAHSIQKVRNCFLLPTEMREFIDKGSVSIDFLNAIGLVNIEIRLLPAHYMFDFYLKNRYIDLSILKIL